MLQLYACLELAIAKRYPSRIRGKLSLLDEAFARCMAAKEVDPELAEIHSVDAIRKVRAEMERRVRAATSEKLRR
jgi:hypothetical protein